jgi:Uncharacterised protein conserved in bacteria (DUF2336)
VKQNTAYSSRHDADRDEAVALLSNPAFDLAKASLAAILETFPADDGVHGAMIGRAALPPEIIVKLGILVADDQLATLIARHVSPIDGARRPAASRATADGDRDR